MQLSHTHPVASAIFDDPNLLSTAGLVPVVALDCSPWPTSTCPYRPTKAPMPAERSDHSSPGWSSAQKASLTWRFSATER